MSINKIINATKLDNNLTSIANTIRNRSDLTQQLNFPSDFITQINHLSLYDTDGLIDCSYDKEGKFSTTIFNNIISNFSTTLPNIKCYFMLKRPILIQKNDVIQINFNNRTGTSGYSWFYIITVPYGIITINENFNMTGNNPTISMTETTYDSYEIIGIGLGPRHTIPWDNFGATIHISINNEQIF